MLFAWLVVVIAVVGLKGSIGGNTSDNFKIPGTEAQQGIDLLNERFPGPGWLERAGRVRRSRR